MKNIENSLAAIIDRKLNQEMTDEEKMNFDELLANDGNINDEFLLHAEIDEAIAEADIINLRQNLNSIHESAQTTKTNSVVRSIFRTKLHRIAAAAFFLVLIFGSISIYFMNDTNTVSNENLFRIYYQPDAALLIRGQSEDKMLIDGFQKYENRDYSGALSMFNKILETDPDNMPVQFYAGLSNIETGKYQNALKPFNHIINNNRNLYVEKARWYAGLCYLKLNDNVKAHEIFKEISTSNSTYKYKAKNLLKSIKK
ncbi:tol-pal system YbgF family protein [Bacteroidota bacterium]